MSGILYEDIPSLDLADFVSGDDDQRTRFVQDLGEAYNNIGFVAIKNHGLSQELQDRLYAVIRKFFALPEGEIGDAARRIAQAANDALAQATATIEGSTLQLREIHIDDEQVLAVFR